MAKIEVVETDKPTETRFITTEALTALISHAGHQKVSLAFLQQLIKQSNCYCDTCNILAREFGY